MSPFKPGLRDWKMRIDDILVCIGNIRRYTSDMGSEDFKASQLTIDAVIHNFQIIGEASSHIPLKIQKQYPQIAWIEMRSMRNILVHEYHGVSLSIVWKTIVDDLGDLETKLANLLIDTG